MLQKAHTAGAHFIYMCTYVYRRLYSGGASGSHCYGPGGMGQGAPFLVGPAEGTASAGHREVGPTSGLVVGPGREAGGAGGPALLGTLFVGAWEGVWGSGESLGEAGLEQGPLSVVRSSTTSSTQRSRPRRASGGGGARGADSGNALESALGVCTLGG